MAKMVSWNSPWVLSEMKKPPWRRSRSVVVPGGRTRAWPTSSRAKLPASRSKVRVTSVPPAPMPLRAIVSVLRTLVVLIWKVPLANRKMP